MDITAARVVQLFFRVLTLFFTAKCGIDSQHAQALATPGAEFCGALICFFLDHFIHSARFGAFKAFWNSLPDGSLDESNTPNRTPMLLLAACVGFALWGGGCAQTETNRAAQGMILVTTHAQTALALHNAHITTHDQEVVIAEDLDAEDAAVKSYYAAIAAGDSSALAAAKAALAAANAVTTAELAKYHLPTTPATTQSSP